MGVTHFPPADVAVRMLVAAGCGLMVGLERQWSHKDLGVRTFTIVSLLGALAALVSQGLILTAFIGVTVLVALTAARNLLMREPVEITTAAALMVTFTLGALAGEGHVFTPPAAVILMTLLLSMKPQLSRFAVGLNQEEVRGAVLLALIAFVIYPVLPDRFVDPWQLFNPREAWLIIVVISSIGFVNYILLRLFSARGLYYSAVFGGLVNSTAAIAELSTLLRGAGEGAESMTVAINLLTVISMFGRNLVLLALFSHAAGLIALWPILAMAVVSTLIVMRTRRPDTMASPLKIGSPLELSKVMRFGLLFLAIQIASEVGQRITGTSGLIIVSVLGGFASSASSTAAVATLAAHGKVSPGEAATGAIAASIASLFSNLPLVYRQFRNARLIRKLILISVLVCALGLAVLYAERAFMGL